MLLSTVAVVAPMTYCTINNGHPLHRHGYTLQIYTEEERAIDDIVAMQDFWI